MEYEAITLGVITFIFSAIILWKSIKNMISKKSIGKFLPFFFLGFVISFYASFILFELFFSWEWVILESAILIALVWIFVNLWRTKSW